MGLAESLRRAVGYLGESLDEGYDDGETGRRSRSGADDRIYNQQSPTELREVREQGIGHLALVGRPQSEFHLIVAREFDDAQQIADRLRADTPVIVSMQSCQAEIAKRLIDFCSGLTYALAASLLPIDETTLLLVPGNGDLSGGARASHLKSGFFNQV